MGEANRRAERRREAMTAGKPAPQYSPKVAKVRELNAVTVDKLAFETEYAAVLKDNPKIGPVSFAEAVLESGLEYMRQGREAREYEEKHKNDLVAVATPEQVAKVLSAPVVTGKRTPQR